MPTVPVPAFWRSLCCGGKGYIGYRGLEKGKTKWTSPRPQHGGQPSWYTDEAMVIPSERRWVDLSPPGSLTSSRFDEVPGPPTHYRWSTPHSPPMDSVLFNMSVDLDPGAARGDRASQHRHPPIPTPSPHLPPPPLSSPPPQRHVRSAPPSPIAKPRMIPLSRRNVKLVVESVVDVPRIGPETRPHRPHRDFAGSCAELSRPLPVVSTHDGRGQRKHLPRSRSHPPGAATAARAAARKQRKATLQPSHPAHHPQRRAEPPKRRAAPPPPPDPPPPPPPPP
eukprot:Sspe_Gene.29526::Locus_14076_Transcript_4_4_Confidence_0.429_Length_3420::g.29526::m.29526